jgi:glucose/arabinose dehydrogenase
LTIRTVCVAAALLTGVCRAALADPGPISPERPAPGQHPAFRAQTHAPAPAHPSRYALQVLAAGLEHPWGLAFLPDGRILVSERPGRLRIVAADGTISPPVPGVPAVRAKGTGGLLDIALDPDFARNGLVYLSYLEPRGEEAGLAVARARLDWRDSAPALADTRVIFRADKAKGTENVGGRMLFGRDRLLYVTAGDRFDRREDAQSLDSDLGKLIRIAPDGSIPADNPLVGTPGARPEIYALGLRNPEGLAAGPHGALWEVETGAKGGDELNRMAPGINYGWPTITYGRDYSDAPIGIGTAREGLEQPVYYWDPSIAPSNLAVYDGALAAQWKGNIFVAALKGRHVSRLVLKDGRVAAEEEMLGELKARIRDVREGPDGALYVLTDQPDGRLVRVVPQGERMAQRSR